MPGFRLVRTGRTSAPTRSAVYPFGLSPERIVGRGVMGRGDIYKDKPAWDPEEPVTLENLSVFIDGLWAVLDVNPQKWKTLDVEVRKYCLHRLNSTESHIEKIRDIGPQVLAFYVGYLTAHDECNELLDALLDSLD